MVCIVKSFPVGKSANVSGQVFSRCCKDSNWKRRNDFEFNSTNLRSNKLRESAHRLLVSEMNLLGTVPAVYTRHGQEQIHMSVPWNVILNGSR